jgi:hypothetical protein
MTTTPITPEMIAYIEPMYQYQKRNNITGMRLINSLIIHERFNDYKPKVGVVVALCPNRATKTTAIVVIPHVWNEKDPYNKLESSIDVLQFGKDLGQYELMTFLDDCKREPMNRLVNEEMIRRIVEEVVGLQELVNLVMNKGLSVRELCEGVKEKSGDDQILKYYIEIKKLQT